MQPQRHRKGRKLRRVFRANQPLVFAVIFLVLILAVVVLLFWIMGSMRFIMRN